MSDALAEFLGEEPKPKRGKGRSYDNDSPSVTQIGNRWKAPYGLFYWHWQGGSQGYTYNSGYGSQDAIAVGNLVHASIEARVHGTDEPAIPDEHRAKVASAMDAWQTWWDNTVLEIVATETPLYSHERDFNGTLDCVVRDRRERLAIADWKTSKGVYADMLWQLAAYGMLWDENHEEKIAGGFHLVRISKEHGDLEVRHWPELTEAAALFTLLRLAYDLDKKVGKRVK